MGKPLFFSVIIPVYNRPDEVRELLDSLSKQTWKSFEVIIVEDGSTIDCRQEADAFEGFMNIRYYRKENGGPGPARNFGTLEAKGNWFLILDSDCLLPQQYMQEVHSFLSVHAIDFFGGPDAAHPSFTPVQKAISYSMTAFLTTGGIRGGKKKVAAYHPRSFNMGISRTAFEATGGFAKMRFGEDLDLSMRIHEAGFKTALIEGAFVYHKRRTDFRKFFRQIFNSGIARINLYKRHPYTLKAVHFMPAVFVVYTIGAILFALFGWWPPFVILLLYLVAILVDSTVRNSNLEVGTLSVISTIVQHFAYGLGFLSAAWKRIILGRDEFTAFEKNFYK